MTTQTAETTPRETVITSKELLEHWQGHRRLTRKMIEAFPEDKLFNYSVGGMRPFSALVMEFVGMAEDGMIGVATRKWNTVQELLHHSEAEIPHTKAKLLERWDRVTEHINKYWAQIPPGRFQENDVAFGQWEGTVLFFINYWIDNEIHHRGQGYVYLRSLGIEPPAFWDRE